MFRPALLVLCLVLAAGMAIAEPDLRWFKGNTHTHTTRSDGDSEPIVVAKWYKDHGYHFLVLSDHNVLVDPAVVGELVDENFLVIPGEEISALHNRKPIHVNGLNIDELIAPVNDRETTAATIQANVDNVRAIQGVPHINHPNFRWAISHMDLLLVNNYRLLEIYNGHPQVNNLGGSGYPGMEQVWDSLLSSGERIYGIAVDDAHHFQGEFAPHRSNPGKGWVMVKAAELTADALMEALEAGRFYASTGVELEDIVITPQRLDVHIKADARFGYRTEFVGRDGAILARSDSNPAVYQFTGSETYVRAKVYESNGAVAWIQPVFADAISGQ